MPNYKSLPVSLDTVHIYWNGVEPDFDFTGWRYIPPEKEGSDYCYVFQHKAIEDVKLVYWVYSKRLIMQIPSVSGMANGSNHIPYNTTQFEIVENKIKYALIIAVQSVLSLEEAVISRADFYKTLEFHNQTDCETFMNWYSKHEKVGHAKRESYDKETEYHTLKSGLKVRAYQKHKQMPNTPMPPTVRIEVEWRKKFNIHLHQYSAKDIFRNSLVWDKFYNIALNKMKLDGKVLTLQQFKIKIDEILKIEYPRAKNKTITKYKNILISAALDRKTKNIKLKKVLHSKLYKHGTDPYIAECNYTIVATQEERLRQLILEKEDTLCNKNHTIIYLLPLTGYELVAYIRINDSS